MDNDEGYIYHLKNELQKVWFTNFYCSSYPNNGLAGERSKSEGHLDQQLCNHQSAKTGIIRKQNLFE
jgi:hypothetical protein